MGAIAAVVVLAIPVGLYKLTHMWGGLTPEQLVGSIQENGDSIYTYSAGYICRNLPNTAKLLLRSFSAQGAQWVQGVLGTALGEPIVYTVDASWVLGVGFILALLAAALPQAGETVPLGHRTKAGVWGIVLCVIALSFVTALNWTPSITPLFFWPAGALLAARAAAGAGAGAPQPHLCRAKARRAQGGICHALPDIVRHSARCGFVRDLPDAVINYHFIRFV